MSRLKPAAVAAGRMRCIARMRFPQRCGLRTLNHKNRSGAVLLSAALRCHGIITLKPAAVGFVEARFCGVACLHARMRFRADARMSLRTLNHAKPQRVRFLLKAALRCHGIITLNPPLSRLGVCAASRGCAFAHEFENIEPCKTAVGAVFVEAALRCHGIITLNPPLSRRGAH